MTTATKPDLAAVIARKERGYIKSFGADRTCHEPDCETVLSRYNDAEACWRHRPES